MWFKNGSLEPARPCCLAVWWPPLGARIWGFWCLGCLGVKMLRCWSAILVNRRGHEAGNYGFDTQSSGSKPWCLDVFSVFCRELQSLTKTVYFLVDPGVTFLPPGLGEMWFKNGSRCSGQAMLFSCLVAVRLGLGFGGFGVWVSGCHIKNSYGNWVLWSGQAVLI